MNYQFNCTCPDDYDLLSEIVDNMQNINGDTFFRRVELQELRNSLMYDLGDYYTSKTSVKRDYGVSFYKCTVNNKLYYIFQNPCIEYIYN